ncbi:SAM-dependent methyltransferase [Spongiactinospora gelatinilytica]|uniref:SAM-dependent methyltransferase n=1 Tax=Spongiactinospora gelatinilytica TaxID=2666298 RepID=A0A2W2G3V6_9ACTN|nr:methyltransferase [Spongiactinospora gelatinilytica]PZG32110.1 SAM-dependent methyltransferase [Spongiactinospora gelatinilytica]
MSTENAERDSLFFLIDEALGYVHPAALRAAASLKVADRLADGPLTAAEPAERTGTDATVLHRIMRLLATRGVFEEAEDGRFRLTSVGHALRSDVPLSGRAAVLMLTDRTLRQPSGRLERCLSMGGSVFDDMFGMSFFEYFAQDEQTTATFHDGMAAMSDWENAPIAAAYGFPESGVVADIGGGQGGFLLAVLDGRPGLHGVLYDEAHVLAKHRPPGAELSGGGRLLHPRADVYLLKRILHDWNDEQCVTILRNCRRAMAPGGRVRVVDAVIPKGNEPHQAKTVDVMLMASLPGRERTSAEFAELFAAAGLRLSRVVATGTMLSVVEAVADEGAGG